MNSLSHPLHIFHEKNDYNGRVSIIVIIMIIIAYEKFKYENYTVFLWDL